MLLTSWSLSNVFFADWRTLSCSTSFGAVSTEPFPQGGGRLQVFNFLPAVASGHPVQRPGSAPSYHPRVLHSRDRWQWKTNARSGAQRCLCPSPLLPPSTHGKSPSWPPAKVPPFLSACRSPPPQRTEESLRGPSERRDSPKRCSRLSPLHRRSPGWCHTVTGRSNSSYAQLIHMTCASFNVLSSHSFSNITDWNSSREYLCHSYIWE